MLTESLCLCLCPRPKSFVVSAESTLPLASGLILRGAEGADLQPVREELTRILPAGKNGGAAVTLQEDMAVPSQGYTLTVDGDGIAIRYGDPAGAYYAAKTLRQIISLCGGELPYLTAEDAPDFPVRGVMLDIGRGKIPTMETLFRLIERLSDLKLNQLHLYMEGYSFQYGDYRPLFPEETPITANEIRALDAWAKAHFVELVPTQNCFGHMESWLATEQFRDLAENPDGFTFMPGFRIPSSTLNPLDGRSEKLIKSLLHDLIPHFSSGLVNIGMDEPFELGTGKSAAVCAERGTGPVYMDFLNKVCRIAEGHGKKPMAWGDILISHPELLPQLPGDLTVLDWNYEGVISFENHCRLLRETGAPFYVCPGTSSWNSLAGRLENMKQNLLDAARQGKKYGAAGYLITDWGDNGHWQALPVSYPGYIFGASAAWNTEGCEDLDLAGALDRFYFHDEKRLMGNILLALGDYGQYERLYLPNCTLTFNLLVLVGLCTREELEQKFADYRKMIQASTGGAAGTAERLNYDFQGLGELLANAAGKLNYVNPHCEDADTVKAEIENTIRLLKQGSDLLFFILFEREMSCSARRAWLHGLLRNLDEITATYRTVWLARNRAGGLERSMRQFAVLRKQYEEKLATLKCDD